jgi:HlyD family secretion protein
MTTLKAVRRRRVVAIMMVAIGVAAAVYVSIRRQESPRYLTQAVTRGTIVRSVSATGTVNPVITVQVGTYVSGPIQAIYTDFNARVKAGQLCAKIDPRPYQILVDQARAALANSAAQLVKDRADLAYREVFYRRSELLLKAHVLAQDTYDAARSAADQARAQIKLDEAAIDQRKAALKQAETNLSYTNIVSPVDGTVVARNVDVGQTVAASFQTPTLFLIAKDLTEMQVDTNVSESDIGPIHAGQETDFTVDTFPDRKFEGVVAQVRQAPITVQNVVTYDVVVSVANPEFLLRPGMTANVSIVVDHRDNVLRVPIDALRFVPPQSGRPLAEVAAATESGQRKTQVWIPGPAGRLWPVAVKLGIDNGSFAELLGGNLRPGDAVVTSLAGPGPRTPNQAVLALKH